MGASTKAIFHAIVAMSKNGVIGDQGKIPWHLPEDFRWFKQKTMGDTLVMGRKTFESIGRPLPGRKTIVLTHDKTLKIEGVEVCCDLDLKFKNDELPEGIYWICGGAQIYHQFLSYCHYLYLTRVNREVAGDAYFKIPDSFSREDMEESSIFENQSFRIERWNNQDLEYGLPAWPDNQNLETWKP